MPEEKDLSVEGESKQGESKPSDASESLRSVLDSFAETLRQVRAERSAPPPAAPAPSGPSAEELQQQLLKETEGVIAEYDRLSKEGEHAAALKLLIQYQARVAQLSQGDPTATPGYKALANSAKRVVRHERAEEFRRWGDEIEAEIASLPVASRIDPEEVDRAVARVRARHADELLAEKEAELRKRLEDEYQARLRAPQNRPSGHSRAGAAVELEPGYRQAARILGIPEDEYAKLVAELEEAQIKSGLHQGMVELLPPGKPAPGGGI